MDERQTRKQIQQMCRFIEQEAREKVNEIKLRTEQERDKQLAFLDLEGRRKIDDEFTMKRKGLNVQKRIMKAKASQKELGRKMNVRQDLINGMLDDAKAKLGQLSRTSDYKNLVLKLLVQGLLKLQEPTVKVKCRQQDLSLVKSITSDAIKEYQKFMKKECGVTPKCKVVVDDKRFVSEKSPGGVVLLGHNSKIICDNTLETRLKTAFEDLKPVVRTVVFPSSVAKVFENPNAEASKEEE
eukprot:g1488.t1